MHIEDRNKRDFYENEAIRSDWNVNILKRRFYFSLYERLALSRDKNDVMRFWGFDTLGKCYIYAKEYKLYLPDEKLFHVIRKGL